MFELRIECQQEDWLLFIEAQNIEKNQEHYVFTTAQKAGEILSRYMIYTLKKRSMDELINKKWISEAEQNEVLLHVPNQLLMDGYSMIRSETDLYIETNDCIPLEGFISFRLKKASDVIRKAFKKGYEEFCDIDLGDSIQLKQIMQDQRSLEKDMYLIISNHLFMTLRSAHALYFQAQIGVDDYETEDNIVSQLVMTAPKKLHVFDPHDKLSKQMVIILRQLFEEKVMFYREEYVSDTNK